MALRFDSSSDDCGAGSVQVYLGQHGCIRRHPQNVVEQQPRVASKVLQIAAEDSTTKQRGRGKGGKVDHMNITGLQS